MRRKPAVMAQEKKIRTGGVARSNKTRTALDRARNRQQQQREAAPETTRTKMDYNDGDQLDYAAGQKPGEYLDKERLINEDLYLEDGPRSGLRPQVSHHAS